MPPHDTRSLDETRIAVSDERISKAHLILKHAHESVHALRTALTGVRGQRSARGALTDEEQDLLRAMLVMATAGLDSMLKQLIRDALPDLVKADVEVAQGLQTFVARKLRGGVDESSGALAHSFLARILTAELQQKQTIEEYISELTGESLQSTDQLMKAASSLGIGEIIPGSELTRLREIFGARNQIVHELDIDFSGARRNRRSRRMGLVTTQSNIILGLGQKILEKTTEKLLPA